MNPELEKEFEICRRQLKDERDYSRLVIQENADMRVKMESIARRLRAHVDGMFHGPLRDELRALSVECKEAVDVKPPKAPAKG